MIGIRCMLKCALKSSTNEEDIIMNPKNLIAITMLLGLTGCGTESDSNERRVSITPVAPAAPDGMVRTWQRPLVAIAMNNTSVIKDTTSDVCLSGNINTVETTHFIVGFDPASAIYKTEELEEAASMMQVGFNELLKHTNLDAEIDLNINTENKWVGCYDDTEAGTATGEIGQFTFSPATLNPLNPDFTDTYALVKHELFHVVQHALVGEAADSAYDHLPHWYLEASADLFAGKNIDVNSYLLTDFITDTDITPMAVTTSAIDLAIRESDEGAAYAEQLDNMYHASLEYLATEGMTVEHILDVTKNSYNDGFDSAMLAIESELTLPATTAELRDDTSVYNEYIVNGWITSNEQTGSYTDDFLRVEITELKFKTLMLRDAATAAVNQAQDSYVTQSNIANGTYLIFAHAASGRIYGPLQHQITGGIVGDLDFTGIEACTACNFIGE